MNPKLKHILQLIAIIAFVGLLLSIVFNGSERLELACCAIASVSSCIVFFSEKKPKK